MDALSTSFFSSNPAQKNISPILRKEYVTRIVRSLSNNGPLTGKKVLARTHRAQQPPPLHKPPFTSILLNTVDDIINKFIDPPRHSSVDPKIVLSNNFAPVDELPPTECEIIEGALPSCLDGAYIRNGPNPQFISHGPYHLFDGDGMLHSIRISNGKATLCSRYVKTYKYMIENEACSNVFPRVFSGFNGLGGFVARATLTMARVMAGQYHPSNGIGLANTSLALFGDRLYALGETDLPYMVRLTCTGDIQTIGRTDFDGKLRMSMTAHPKVDQDTGETFAFRYGHLSPFLTYFWYDPNGNKKQDVPIFSLPRPTFLHDFAITKKYAIFPDIQIEMDTIGMIFRGGSPMTFNSSKVSRIGVIPRYASDEKAIKWFDVPGFNAIHVINAWDEVDEDGNESIVIISPNIMSVQHLIDRMDLIHASVEKIRIDLKTGLVSKRGLSSRNLDFGVINPAYLGKKNKYIYTALADPTPTMTGIVKLDVSTEEDRQERIVASRIFGQGCSGGEPFFVARDPDNTDADEDDGYIVCYVHDENSGESKFLVMDAKSRELDIVASVKLPQRVPYGFHGLFVRDEDLKRLDMCTDIQSH